MGESAGPGTGDSSFGSLLLRYRRSAGLSQEALARASGMSVRALRELERGRAQAAQRRSAEVLADALNLVGQERQLFLAVAEQGRRRPRKPEESMLGAAAAAPVNLVGRDVESELLRSDTSGTVVVVGPAGVGKTALAVSAAHALRERFPDGCLVVDLRGADEEPVTVGAALESLLRALGVPSGRIPVAADEKANLYQALVERKRALLLLDNAADEAQVRPLVAGGPECLTVITCRRVLAGLDSVRRVWLAPLAEADAVGLLERILGADRVAAERAAAGTLVALCGYLPLAVRIVADRLVTEPDWSMGYLVDQLRDERMRLAALSAGDLQVRPAFEMSYRRLSPPARAVFRVLTVVPGMEFGEELAAVAVGPPQSNVATCLEELADASLLQLTPVPGRFRFHDLIRIFARERLEAEEAPQTRQEYHDAVLRHLLAKATAAARLFLADGSQPADAVRPSQFATREEAAEWLVREKANWTAAQRVAAELSWHREVVDLARAMHWMSDSRIPEQPWDEIFELGLSSARALGSRVEEAHLLNQFGWANYMCHGDVESARAKHTEALAIAREIGNAVEQATSHGMLSLAMLRLGEIEPGLEHARQATILARAQTRLPTGDPRAGALLLSMRNAQALALRATGGYAEALRIHREVLSGLNVTEGSSGPLRQWLRAMALDEVGMCLAGLGEWRQAAEAHLEARLTFAVLGAAYREARSSLLEGAMWRRAGRPGPARERLEFALGYFAAPHYPDERARVVEELASTPRQDRCG